VGNKLASCV